MPPASRRQFIQAAAVVSLASSRLPAFAAPASSLALIGTQTTGASKGIYAYAFDSTNGELKQTGLAAESPMPTFMTLAPDRKHLYAVNELDEFQGHKSGSVSSFSLERKPGPSATLTAINQVPSRGGGPCHISLDHTGKCAFIANYGGGSAASFRIASNGALSEAVSFFQYTGHGVDKDRQEAPHAHRATVAPNNRFVMINDLGLDVIHIYKLDAATATLTPNTPSEWKATPGSGPRALQFHPNGKWAYCVTEMHSSVNVLNWHADTGALETIQEISMSPEGFSGETAGDDIVFDAKGQYAYVANRLDDYLATFSVSQSDGKLTLLGRSSCGGKVPRHIALDPTGHWLLVANQVSDNIAVFARNPTTGRLAAEGKSFPLARPQCIVFA